MALVITLKEGREPMILQLGDKKVKIYLHRLESAKQARLRIDADKDIAVLSPSLVKRGITDKSGLYRFQPEEP